MSIGWQGQYVLDRCVKYYYLFQNTENELEPQFTYGIYIIDTSKIHAPLESAALFLSTDVLRILLLNYDAAIC